METINYKGMKLYNGVLVKGEIRGIEVEGRLRITSIIPEHNSIYEEEAIEMYFCQNKVPGADCGDKFGYKYSYIFGLLTESDELRWDTEIFRVIEEMQSIIASKIDIKGERETPERREDTTYTDGIKINISN